MVGLGYHFALSRENAKRIFAAKGGEEIGALIAEFHGSKEMKANSQILPLKRTWDAIHRCLTEGELDPAGGDFPMNHVILGGKVIHNGDDYIAVVIRPDMLTFITEALHDLKEPEFRAKFFALGAKGYDQPLTDKEYALVWNALQEINGFFAYCEEERVAVLFTGAWK